MANNQDQGQRGEGQTVEQQRAAAQQQGGRLQSDPNQQRSGGQQQGQQGQQGQQRSGQQQGGQQQGGQQAGQDQAQQARRASFDEHKRSVQERPQQVGSPDQQPTPTQQENDEIRAGLRHVDDKEDDRSGGDFKLVRRFEADDNPGKYETR